jgi:hypothetical protein
VTELKRKWKRFFDGIVVDLIDENNRTIAGIFVRKEELLVWLEALNTTEEAFGGDEETKV